MTKPIVNARAMLLERGKKILLQRGYFALSVSGLTKQCNMGTGTFYSYFPSKADLAVAIAQKDWDEMLTQMDLAINSKLAFEEKLRHIYLELKAFTDVYMTYWAQFGAERGNVERFAVIQTNCIRQVAERVLRVIREITREYPEVVLPLASDKLALLIVENMFVIAKTPVFTFDNFAKFLRNWAFVIKTANKGN